MYAVVKLSVEGYYSITVYRCEVSEYEHDKKSSKNLKQNTCNY